MEQNKVSRSRPTNVWLTDFLVMPRQFNEGKDSFYSGAGITEYQLGI